MDQEDQQRLDQPIWTALSTKHSHLRLGGELARRYHPEVAPFAALAEQSASAFSELAQIMEPDAQAAFLSFDKVEPGNAFSIEEVGKIHQMLASDRFNGNADDAGVIELTEADVADMLALAQKTKPGPFGPRTINMGRYIGIRDQGRLIAMAGERMQFDGYVEISAVCVDDTHRGKGLAGRLMQILRKDIVQRGNRAFLHVFDTNQSAIRLYEQLGFELRQAFRLSRLTRTE